jgi:hypothetical protein
MKKTAQLLMISLVSMMLCLAASFVSQAALFSTSPVADAFVTTGPTGNLSDNNYGGGNALAVAAPGLTNGEFQTVLKFDLSGAASAFNAQFGVGQWSIQSAALQLVSSPHNNAIYNDIVPGLFGVSLMQNNSWIEGTGNASNPTNNGITFNLLQSAYINPSVDQSLGTFSFTGGSSGTNSYTLSLSSGLRADIVAGSQASLCLFGADTSVSYLFSARSASAGARPQLLITAVPEPGGLVLCGVALSLLFVLRLFSRANGPDKSGRKSLFRR